MPNSRALTAPNLFLEAGGRRLAYRSIGSGTPILLCTRFRGTMDAWDPAFLDALAACSFRVITFDYSGLGLSTGTPSYNPADLARDALDLAAALDLPPVVLGGWSLGGMAAQVAMALHPERVSHGVLIGTTPPGTLVKLAEQIFFDTASIPDNSFEDEVVLFFEPASPASRAAARRSVGRIAQRGDRSIPVPPGWAKANLPPGPMNPIFPADAVLEALKSTTIPLLHIGGDHDIIFPVENWYALNGQLPTLRLLTFPSAGHAPQHQEPESSAEAIAAFVRSTS